MSSALEIFRSQVVHDLLLLAQWQNRELQPEDVARIGNSGFSDQLALNLESQAGREGLMLLDTALEELRTNPDQSLYDEHAVDFAAIYLNNQYGASPCESVWIDEDGLTMQEPMFQNREWFTQMGLEVPDWRLRTDDHLVVQLQFVAILIERPGIDSLAQAARYLDEHLLRWIHDFARRVASRSLTPLYAGLVTVMVAYLEELRDVMVVILDQPRPSPEEIEERMKPRAQVEVNVPESFLPGAAPSW